MDRAAIAGEARGLLEEFLRAKGVDLVEVACRYEGGGLVLRILLDYPDGGITVGECAALNKEISLMLEEKHILEERYALEVCSPGLERPLKSRNDFLRCKNKRVRFFLSELINGKVEWEGLIDKVDEQAVYIKRGQEAIEIPLCKINKAKQVI